MIFEQYHTSYLIHVIVNLMSRKTGSQTDSDRIILIINLM